MTRDEVICGLEHHATPTHCDGCPYDDGDMECESALMRDAIVLLKEERRCETCMYYEKFIKEYGECIKDGLMRNADWYCADWEAKNDNEG